MKWGISRIEACINQQFKNLGLCLEEFYLKLGLGGFHRVNPTLPSADELYIKLNDHFLHSFFLLSLILTPLSLTTIISKRKRIKFSLKKKN